MFGDMEETPEKSLSDPTNASGPEEGGESVRRGISMIALPCYDGGSGTLVWTCRSFVPVRC